MIMSKKLTTREVADSLLLISMIANNKEGRAGERIRETVKGLPAGTPVYDVRVSINEIDLDFHDFAGEVQRQLVDMVRREAGELLKQTVGSKMDDLIASTHETLQRLNEGVQQKAADLLGYNPWKAE